MFVDLFQTFTTNFRIHDIIHHVSKAWYFTASYYKKKKTVGGKTHDWTVVKSCSAPNCQNRKKKGCVTPFYRIPRNKDQKRCWLTFLCHKTLPNVEYMYVWMHACMDGWMDGCLYVCGEYFVTGKYIIYHKTVFHFPLLLENLQHSL